MSGTGGEVPSEPIPSVVDRLLRGDPLALSRAITAVENATNEARGIVSAIQPHRGRAKIIGVTGAPGAGKSTLIDALIGGLRSRGLRVGVLAVDPSSPLTGGAILGDRVRMSTHASDPGVFIRSLASRGHLGGLTRTASEIIQVMDAAAHDVVIVETVGAGQSEVEVADHVAIRVVVCVPGLGDDVQALKAGILEIADVLVVNKSDLPGAAATVRHLERMLDLRDPALDSAVICSTSAITGEGVDGLIDVVLDESGANLRADRPSSLSVRRRLADAVARTVRDAVLENDDPEVEKLCAGVGGGEIPFDEAVGWLLDRWQFLSQHGVRSDDAHHVH